MFKFLFSFLFNFFSPVLLVVDNAADVAFFFFDEPEMKKESWRKGIKLHW